MEIKLERKSVLVIIPSKSLAELAQTNPLNQKETSGILAVYDLRGVMDFDWEAITALFNQVWEIGLYGGAAAICAEEQFKRLLVDCVSIDLYARFFSTREAAITYLAQSARAKGVDSV